MHLYHSAALVAAFFVAASVPQAQRQCGSREARLVQAEGASRCNTREAIRKQLAERYGEVPIAGGLSAAGVRVEIYASPGGRTWSMVVTWPRRQSCLVDTGENWRPVQPKPYEREG